MHSKSLPARPVRLRRVPTLVLAAVMAVAPGSALAHPRPAEPMDAGEIAHALHRLQTAGSALYVAAHPDDENTALLAWLTHVKGVRAAYLSMTRGDGGQNLLGQELGPALGVIRTQELLAARGIYWKLYQLQYKDQEIRVPQVGD